MSRFIANCSTIVDRPAEESEVISSSPAIWPRRRSSGVVTRVAMVSALAPGYWVETTSEGASISGRAATGSLR